MTKNTKKILAIANTTYQIVVLLYLIDSFYMDCEFQLVVTNKTPLLEKLFKEEKLNNYFSKVYFADSRKIKNKNKGALQTLWESFVYNKTTKDLLGTTLGKYQELLYASPVGVDEITKEISKTLIKNNPMIIIRRFEDGFGSYTSLSGHVVSSESGRKMYGKFLNFHNLKQENTLYLFEPTLAKNSENYNFIKIPTDNIEIIHRAKIIFNYKPTKIQEKFIFFGQGTQEFVENAKTYQTMVYEIADIVGKENFIVKKHPRSVWDEYDDSIHKLNVEYPWELLESEDALQNKVLISYSSTACITGKLLYNSNTHVVYLYPLAKDSFRVSIEFNEYFEKAEKEYSNIHIARTKEELLEILKELC